MGRYLNKDLEYKYIYIYIYLSKKKKKETFVSRIHFLKSIQDSLREDREDSEK